MPTAAQITALAEYATARKARQEADDALVWNLAAAAETARELEGALARGDELSADLLRAQINALERRIQGATQARAQQQAATDAARDTALAAGAGFDLLSARHPLLLLPARLEARFAWLRAGRPTFAPDPNLEQVLLVRVYPDEIHEDGHDPHVTTDEMDALIEFDKKIMSTQDIQPILQAWKELAARVGPTRAGWIGEAAITKKTPGRRAARFARSAIARLLPDRWCAVAELDDGSVVSALSNPTRDPLEMGVSADAIAWTTDFAVAESVGMAIVIRNLPSTVQSVRRLRVVGVRGTLGPDATRAELETLLRAHQFTRGLELLAPGTPTNSLPGKRSGYTTRPSPDDVVAVNQGRFLVGGRSAPFCQPGDLTDGTALASALGIDVATFGFVRRADATDQHDARNLRTLLLAATRRTIPRHVAGLADAAIVDELLWFGASRVSALGPLPAFRVGAQPYGVLPVLRRDHALVRDGYGADRYLPMLDRLRVFFETATGAVDRVGNPTPDPDPAETLIRILQQDAIARRIVFRPFLGRELAREVVAGLDRGDRDDLPPRRTEFVDLLATIGLDVPPDSTLAEALHLTIAPPLNVPLVEPDDAPANSVQLAAEYLELVAQLRVDALYRHEYPGGEQPKSLLFALARLAVLETADARARELLEAEGASSLRWDDEDVPSQFVDPYASMQRRLEAFDPLATSPTPLGYTLSESGRDAYVLAHLRQALRELKTRSTDLLEEMLRASLGLFGSRLDAWYTALASEEIEVLRSDPATATGLNVGAYGVLEDIRRSPRVPVPGAPGLYTNPMNGGYLHAPSVNQGATAAVLRSVHLAHAAAGHGESFSVDLSSVRARRGLELAEGIRTGQPLSALLGYRIERELRAEGLARLIAPFRQIAPLVANRLTPSTLPAESVAATNVIDGLTLLEQAGYDGRQAASSLTLWTRQPSLGPALPAVEQQAVDRVFATAQEGIDAVADLTLAESVYQTVLGNPVHAGAAVDAVSGAPVPPSDFSIVKTPRSGVALTHRLLLLLGDPSTAGTVTGWSATPRSRAEPRLDAWARSLLPRPSQIRLRARFVAADGDELAALDDVTLEEVLDDAATDAPHLGLSALDFVALAEPNDTPQRNALETRLAALLDRMRPAAAEAVPLELVFERPTYWDAEVFGIVETLEIAKSIRNLVGLARPLGVDDVARPGRSGGAAVNLAELADRATKAESELAAVKIGVSRADLDDATSMRSVLFGAESLGIAGAAPAFIRDSDDEETRAHERKQLEAQVAATLTEVQRREAVLSGVAANDSVARLQAIFGEAFAVVPSLIPPDAITAMFDPSAAPAGGDEPAARTWLSRAARIREHVRALDEVLGFADAVTETQAKVERPQLRVGQIGGEPGERWAALPLLPDTTLPGGRVSMVAVVDSAGLPTQQVAGLLVDEWVEVVPSTAETTSLTFHYDAPTSAPPHVLLFGVPYPTQESWEVDDVLDIVDEALALARIRMVDTGTLSDLGQLLPLLVTAENPAGDRAGLDIEILTAEGTA